MRILGPGIQPGSSLGLVGSHVDLAPTWLGLAGLPTPRDMDGRSLVRKLLRPDDVDAAGPAMTASTNTAMRAVLPRSVTTHMRYEMAEHRRRRLSGLSAGQGRLPVGGAYIEYHGLGPTGASSPPFHRQQDALNNTYRALRVIDRRPEGLGDVMYAEFGTYGFETIHSREYFNVSQDRWQQHNLYTTLSLREQAEWAQRVKSLFGCTGASCRMMEGPM